MNVPLFKKGFWTDNGGFYYYNTIPGMDYEETFIELSNRFKV